MSIWGNYVSTRILSVGKRTTLTVNLETAEESYDEMENKIKNIVLGVDREGEYVIVEHEKGLFKHKIGRPVSLTRGRMYKLYSTMFNSTK